MTLVVIWQEDGFLWSVSDTRISRPGDNGQVILTDSGSKLFSLPVICRHISSHENMNPLPYHSMACGFAFAGDVLPATMTFATAATFTQHLITPSTATILPALKDVAILVCKLAERFSRETLSASNGTYGNFEASLFGYCPVEKTFKVFHLVPHIDKENFSYFINDYKIDGIEPVVIMGSGRVKFLEQMKKLKTEGDSYKRTARLPKIAIESIVDEGQGDVGGSISIGIVPIQGSFQIYSSIQPIEKGKPAARETFNGIDIDKEIGSIGPCIIGMRGMV